MPRFTYAFTRQSGDWPPPRRSRRLRRTTCIYYYQTLHQHGTLRSPGGGRSNAIVNTSSGYYLNAVGYNFIGGGEDNFICNNITGTGQENLLLYNAIGGGRGNEIFNTAPSLNLQITQLNFIGGGESNQIQTGSQYSFIGGGNNNILASRYAGIAGGCNNTVSGTYSSILGGGGNNDNGLAYAGIFGCNINNPLAMSPKTFHVNCLNACDTPPYGGVYPTGTVMYIPATTAMIAIGFPAGSHIALIAP